MRRLACTALIALLATPAFAAGPEGEAKLAGLLQGRVAGAPRSCITRMRGDDQSYTIETIGEVYDVGSTRYVTRFAGGCPQLTRFAFVVSRTPSTALCEGDIAQVFDRSTPPIPLGSCAFGPFTPYTRAH